MVADKANTAIVSKYKVACDLSIIYICLWPVVKIKVKMSYNSNVHISQTVTIKASIVIANTKRDMWHSIGIFTFDIGLL